VDFDNCPDVERDGLEPVADLKNGQPSSSVYACNPDVLDDWERLKP
jgi:hypothetical protein